MRTFPVIEQDASSGEFAAIAFMALRPLPVRASAMTVLPLQMNLTAVLTRSSLFVPALLFISADSRSMVLS